MEKTIKAKHLIKGSSIMTGSYWGANISHEHNITTSMNTTTGATGSFNFSVGLLVIFVLLSIFIVLTNGLVFVLFILRKKLRTATNYLLLGLAFADFLNGALNIPYLLSIMYGLLENNETIGLVSNAFHFFSALASIYHIVLVTGEKYFAVMKPLRRHQVTKPKVAVVIALVWCISGLFSFIQFSWSRGTSYSQIVHTVFLVIAALLLPYPFIVFAFIKMFSQITKRKTELHRGLHGHNSKVFHGQRKDRKCVIVFSLMALVYAMCWFPYYTLTLMYKFGYNHNGNAPLLVVVTIRYLTSLFNPIMYTFFKEDFRMALKSLKCLGSQSSDARENYLKSLSVKYRRGARHNETLKDKSHAELVHFAIEN